MWKNGSWVLHQDNVPAHNALPVKMFFTKHKITVLEHLLYSSDLAPCDFFLFPKIKSALKGNRFESVDAVKAKVLQLWISYQKMTCSIASNSGRFAWSGVGIGERSTSRVTFQLCNFLNKKCSNISPVILQPHHVHTILMNGTFHHWHNFTTDINLSIYYGNIKINVCILTSTLHPKDDTSIWELASIFLSK